MWSYINSSNYVVKVWSYLCSVSLRLSRTKSSILALNLKLTRSFRIENKCLVMQIFKLSSGTLGQSCAQVQSLSSKTSRDRLNLKMPPKFVFTKFLPYPKNTLSVKESTFSRNFCREYRRCFHEIFVQQFWLVDSWFFGRSLMWGEGVASSWQLIVNLILRRCCVTSKKIKDTKRAETYLFYPISQPFLMMKYVTLVHMVF